MSLPRRDIVRGALAAGALGAAAGVVPGLVGCSRVGDRAPSPTPTPAISVSAPSGSRLRWIAHRGGGRDWPEMTAYAYEQAARIQGLQDFEVSVHLSRDGVLVCNHDPDTSVLGSRAVVIAETEWAELRQIMVSPRLTLDPGQPSRPLARLEEVLSAWIPTHTLWVEPKVEAAVEPLFRALAAAGHPEHVVWKQPVNFPYFTRAKQLGYGTWGYVLSGEAQQKFARTYAADPAIDMLGAWTYTPDAEVARTVQWAAENGKRTVMWAIRNADDLDRALGLGCSGLMTSEILGLFGTRE